MATLRQLRNNIIFAVALGSFFGYQYWIEKNRPDIMESRKQYMRKVFNFRDEDEDEKN